MADKSACPDRFLSRSIRSCRGIWRQDHGNITKCSATLPSASERVSSPYGSTVCPKLHCITSPGITLPPLRMPITPHRRDPRSWGEAVPSVWAVAQTKLVKNSGDQYLTNKKGHHGDYCVKSRQRKRSATGKQREQRLRYLV